MKFLVRIPHENVRCIPILIKVGHKLTDNSHKGLQVLLSASGLKMINYFSHLEIFETKLQLNTLPLSVRYFKLIR